MLRVTVELSVAGNRREQAHREAVGWALLEESHKKRGLAETKRILSEAASLKVRLSRRDRPPFVDDAFLRMLLSPVRYAVALFVGRTEDDVAIDWTHEQVITTTGLGVEITIHTGDDDQRRCSGRTDASVKSNTSRPQKKRMRPTSCPLPAVAK